MTDTDFEQNEAHIKQQAARKRRLLKLVEIYHRARMGDYDDTYEDFYCMYLAPRAECDIPRYASVAEDETYGIIHLCATLPEALSNQAGIPENGEYLNVPAGIYDLDGRGTPQIETRTLMVTEYGYATLKLLVESYTSNNEDELRSLFKEAEL